MGGLVRSTFGYLGAIKNFLIGLINKKKSNISQHPETVRGGYDEIINNKSKFILQYIESISAKITSKNKKISRLERQQKELSLLVTKQNGALSLAQRRAKELDTNDPEILSQDSKYKQLRNVYTEKEILINKTKEIIADLEGDIKEDTADIEDHRNKVIQMKGELTALASERDDAVATILAAKADREANEALASLPSNSKSVNSLNHLREVTEQAKASSQVVRELSDLDQKNIDEELIKEGHSNEFDNKFDNLITGSSNDSKAHSLDVGIVETEENEVSA